MGTHCCCPIVQITVSYTEQLLYCSSFYWHDDSCMLFVFPVSCWDSWNSADFSLARINTEQTSSLTPTNVRTPPVHRPCSPRMSPVKTPEHHWKGSEVDCDNFKLLQLQWVVAGLVPFSWSCVWRDNKADIDIDRGCSDGFVVLLPQVPHPLRPLPLVEVHPAIPRQDVALVQRRWKGTDW